MTRIGKLAAALVVLNASIAHAMILGAKIPVTAAPEPATLVLMASGLLAVGLGVHRKRNKKD